MQADGGMQAHLHVGMQVRVIALGCAADLLKDGRAKQAAARQPDFIPTLLQALQARTCTCAVTVRMSAS